jgi:pimeloyl-ACP methyl ester carboxylesterase
MTQVCAAGPAEIRVPRERYVHMAHSDKGLKQRIHRVQAPSLLVWGQDDRLVPLTYADEFARRLPRARIEIVKAGGHAPHLDQPQATAELVRAFLEQAG